MTSGSVAVQGGADNAAAAVTAAAHVSNVAPAKSSIGADEDRTTVVAPNKAGYKGLRPLTSVPS